MPTSRTRGRASRAAGMATRETLIRAADQVFGEHGPSASVAQICAHAQTFPNQVTYYFGSKEQLFVEVACAAVLRAARHAEEAAATARTVGEYADTLITTLLGPEVRGVEMFTTAMLAVAHRPDLTDHITTTLATLHQHGEQALLATLVRTGWTLRASVDVEAKAFWSAIFGLAVQHCAAGDSLGRPLTEAVTVVFTTLGLADDARERTLPGHPTGAAPTIPDLESAPR